MNGNILQGVIRTFLIVQGSKMNFFLIIKCIFVWDFARRLLVQTYQKNLIIPSKKPKQTAFPFTSSASSITVENTRYSPLFHLSAFNLFSLT